MDQTNRNGAELDPRQESFTNCHGVSQHLAVGFPVSGNLILIYNRWRGFHSKRKKFRELKRAFSKASHLQSLKLKDMSYSTLSPHESKLFSGFLKKSRNLRKFECDYRLITKLMTEGLMSSPTVDELYIRSTRNAFCKAERRQDVDAAIPRFAKNSHATLMWIENVRFTKNSPISGILKAPYLTTLSLYYCKISASEKKLLCKLLATQDSLKRFSSDVQFGAKSLVLCWKGESDPRPDLNWEGVKIRGVDEVGLSLFGFIRERVMMARFPLKYNRDILAILERSSKPALFSWRKKNQLLGSPSPQFFYKPFPRARLA